MHGMDITKTCLPYVRIPSVLYNRMLYEINNTDRGILTALIFYCAMNRNGGRIPNCRNWSRVEWGHAGISSNIWTKSVREFSALAEGLQNRSKALAARQGHRRNTDRAWMSHPCPLLAWDGNDLLVLAYPADDERKANSHAHSRTPGTSLAPAPAHAHAPAQEEKRTEEEIERE